MACPFCPWGMEEDLFHAFLDCPHLWLLFATLEPLLRALGRSLSETTYVCSYPYRVAERGTFCLANFLLGQAKMAVLKSRRNWLAGTGSDDAPQRGVPAFEALWALEGVLCHMEDGHLKYALSCLDRSGKLGGHGGGLWLPACAMPWALTRLLLFFSG
ncbi:catenin alpha-3 [Alligator mississippiensis]|uniref:Catenin alpha-3 n=1 Tax=Alligator mississippiensis TaxID=8496 RepID=A0A151P414_ALLMI|nr:catenin alpha-3 [Alligator mississippiensis]